MLLIIFKINSFSRTDMLLQREVMTRPAECSTSGPTRSWPCTATTTSSAASPVSPSASLDACCLPDTMTSTVMFGTPSEQREQVRSLQHCLGFQLIQFYLFQVYWLGMITEFHVWASQRTEWLFVLDLGIHFSRFGTKSRSKEAAESSQVIHLVPATLQHSESIYQFLHKLLRCATYVFI